MRKILTVLISIAFLACDGSDAAHAPETDLPPLEIQSQTFLSGSYLVDQVYRSMKGPQKMEGVQIGGDGPPERIWIVSYETQIVDPETGEVTSEEFMCHNNLDLVDIQDHVIKLGTDLVGLTDTRLFTLSQGAMRVEFPTGFGVPMMSNEKLQLVTQILNLNPIEQSRQIEYRTTLRYVRDRDAKGRLRPLYERGVQSLKLLSGVDGYFGIEHGDAEIHGSSCSVGKLAGERTFYDQQGRSFAAHWIVDPGLEENHTLITEMLGLEKDTTVHYIAAHLHPFARSLELRDLTTGDTVFKSLATNSTDRIGLDHVEFLSSVEGVPLYKDHQYTLISIYDNTSNEPQDAMAVMFLYMLDSNFEEKIRTN